MAIKQLAWSYVSNSNWSRSFQGVVKAATHFGPKNVHGFSCFTIMCIHPCSPCVHAHNASSGLCPGELSILDPRIVTGMNRKWMENVQRNFKKTYFREEQHKFPVNFPFINPMSLGAIFQLMRWVDHPPRFWKKTSWREISDSPSLIATTKKNRAVLLLVSIFQYPSATIQVSSLQNPLGVHSDSDNTRYIDQCNPT